MDKPKRIEQLKIDLALAETNQEKIALKIAIAKLESELN